MKHYCIYECSLGKSKYVTWFPNFGDADLYRTSLNNFRSSDEVRAGVRFVLRCLDDHEFVRRFVYEARYIVHFRIYKRYHKVIIDYSDGSRLVKPFQSLDEYCNSIGVNYE